MQVPEVVRGKNIIFVGHMTEYDVRTGLHTIRFEDGEEDEFDDSNIEAFRVKAGQPRKKPQANSLLIRPYPPTNPLNIAGFFPKARGHNSIMVIMPGQFLMKSSINGKRVTRTSSNIQTQKFVQDGSNQGYTNLLD